jgi:hypothetical protein
VSRPSERFSLIGNLVRITRAGDRPRLAFYTAQHTIDSQGYLRIERVTYLGSRLATKDEQNIIANYRPGIAQVPGNRTALASYRNVSIRDRYTRPHAIRPGPVYTGPLRQPIQKARFTVRLLTDKGTIQTRRVLYRFYDKKSLQRFQRLEQQGRLPIPVIGDSVDYGLHPRQYRIQPFKSRQRGHGS